MKKKYLVVKALQNLGNPGDVVYISRGYAKNYLLPNHFVIEASEANIKLHKEKIEKIQAALNKELLIAKKIADLISSCNLKIQMRADDLGNLYGSVSNKIISDKIKEQYNVSINYNKINIDNILIKKIGEFKIKIKLHSDVIIDINLIVDKI